MYTNEKDVKVCYFYANVCFCHRSLFFRVSEVCFCLFFKEKMVRIWSVFFKIRSALLIGDTAYLFTQEVVCKKYIHGKYLLYYFIAVHICFQETNVQREKICEISFLPSPVQCTGLGHCVACESACQRVCNHFSPHPPPYIELSFSSSLCWYIYSPQTTQIQALEEGSARTCVGGTPQGPHTLHRDEMTPPPPPQFSLSLSLSLQIGGGVWK